MDKPAFTINAIDIASANLGWLVAQMLLGIMVTKKIMDAKEAKDVLAFCASRYTQGPPDRALIRKAVLDGLGPLLKQYDVPPQGQQH
jgi:hypothetical protein